MAVIAGTDFFRVEVLTWRGLGTYYVLFFLDLETRRVSWGGITRHPTETWMKQFVEPLHLCRPEESKRSYCPGR